MENCIFCKIAKGEIPSEKIYEDDKVIAFLDIGPSNPGHTLFIPKKHYENLLDINEKDLCYLISIAKKLAPKILKAVNSHSFNLFQNNGEIAGQVIKHIHFHLVPRFENDGLSLWASRKMSKEELRKIADSIRKAL